MTIEEHARSAIADALDLLEHLTTEQFANGGDRNARELLVEALVVLGSDPAGWKDYHEAAARGYRRRVRSHRAEVGT